MRNLTDARSERIWDLLSKHEPLLTLLATRVARDYNMEPRRGTLFVLRQVNRSKRIVRKISPLN